MADRLPRKKSDGAAADRAARRTVELNGFGLLEDGTTFSFVVEDLSYDGCKVQTSFALKPGTPLKFSILGLGSSVDAVVRWSRGGTTGLEFKSEEVAAPAHAPRQNQRLELSATLSLRRTGRQHYQARLFDLTPTGCKVEFVERPKTGEVLWAKFDGLDAIEGLVRWIDGFYGGLEFVRPIYPAVFDMLVRRLQG